MTTTPTLVEMAREIEKRKPGALPKSLACDLPEPLSGTLWILSNDHSVVPSCPDDLAHTILVGAMVMATKASRVAIHAVNLPSGDGWEVGDDVQERDSDHGNCPTRSLFAAFCAAVPEPKETT